MSDSEKPPSPETRILTAARALFYRDGVAAVSTDRLAREAGVSKTTIYKYFGDLNAVLAAVVSAEVASLHAPQTEPPAEPRAALIAFGDALMGVIADPDVLTFDKLMHEEARHHPDITAKYYENSYANSLARLTEVIADGQARGLLRADLDASTLADLLISMWSGLGAVRVRLNLQPQLHEDPGGWVRLCVEALFGPAMR